MFNVIVWLAFHHSYICFLGGVSCLKVVVLVETSFSVDIPCSNLFFRLVAERLICFKSVLIASKSTIQVIDKFNLQR